MITIAAFVMLSCSHEVDDKFAKSIELAKIVTKYDSDTNIEEVDTVKFGSYVQNGNDKEPIEWIVLDKQDNKVFLLSKYILDCKCYSSEWKNDTWNTCDLRKWLNNDFFRQAFSANEQRKINTTKVINSNLGYGLNGGESTEDKVFCLSIEEVMKYFGYGVKEVFGYRIGKIIATKGTDYARTINNNGINLKVYSLSNSPSYTDPIHWAIGNSSFWLRSPSEDNSFYSINRIAVVSYLGFIDAIIGDNVDVRSNGVRPAIWVSY